MLLISRWYSRIWIEGLTKHVIGFWGGSSVWLFWYDLGRSEAGHRSTRRSWKLKPVATNGASRWECRMQNTCVCTLTRVSFPPLFSYILFLCWKNLKVNQLATMSGMHSFQNSSFSFVKESQSSSVSQVIFNSLWPHGLWLTKLPCPQPTSGACLNSCPLSQWIWASEVIGNTSTVYTFLAAQKTYMSYYAYLTLHTTR